MSSVMISDFMGGKGDRLLFPLCDSQPGSKTTGCTGSEG
jgi:hypothetical protein